MESNLIVYSIPFFFLLIGVELLVSRARRLPVYRLNDSINDLSCGVFQQVIGVFMKAITAGVYIWLFQNYHWLDISATSVLAWIVLFFGVDFFYYWFHRVSHEMALPWGGHVVHHQSEEYNLAVALRQGGFQPLFSWVFYLPLALIGFSPAMFFTMSAINTIYQFWIHTRLVGSLGPLEWFLNTPSHHRVHHGRNPQYLDKNYAGILIIWDRMFGSFEPESEPVVYGIIKPLASWNPLWAQVHYFLEIFEKTRHASGFLPKLKVWFMPPGWIPEGNPAPPLPPPLDAPRYDIKAPQGLNGYILLSFVVATLVAVALLVLQNDLDLGAQLGLGVFVVWSLLNFGAIFERRRWALASEKYRLVFLQALVVVLAWETPFFIPVTLSVILVQGAFLAWLYARLERFVPSPGTP